MDPGLYPIWKVLFGAVLAGVIYYFLDRFVFHGGLAWWKGKQKAAGKEAGRQRDFSWKEVLIWGSVLVALCISGGAIFMSGPMQRVADVSSFITEQRTDLGIDLREFAKIANRVRRVKIDVDGGHVDGSQYAVVDGVEENHTWILNGGGWVGKAGITLKGHREEAPPGKHSKINVEVGVHNSREEHLALLVLDMFADSDSVMQKGPNEGEWQAEWELVGDSGKGVSKVTIRPSVHRDKGRQFHICLRFAKHESRETISTQVLYIDPCDFGQETLGYVSGTLSWPFDIGEQYILYAGWEREDSGASQEMVLSEWSLEPLSDLNVWVESKRSLSFRTVGELKRPVAFLYKRGKPKSLPTGHSVAQHVVK